MCVFEGSMLPSIGSKKSGVSMNYTAHKHKCLFKIIHKRHLKVPKKEVQIPPKSSPRDHQTPKNHPNVAGARKKPILGGRVPHRARQKGPKVDLQTGPTAQKSKIYVLYQKNMICGVSLEATEAPFGR